jgi:hypothetical protein
MTNYFLDSSAMGKHSHAEIGTAKVDALLQEPGAHHFISRLTGVEVQSVFASKVRTRVLAEADFQLLRLQFANDIARRLLRVIRITDWHYQKAEQLIRRHGLTRRLRTLDALQLSVALDLRQRGLLDSFVCADKSLCTVANEEGLPIIDPEQP